MINLRITNNYWQFNVTRSSRSYVQRAFQPLSFRIFRSTSRVLWTRFDERHQGSILVLSSSNVTAFRYVSSRRNVRMGCETVVLGIYFSARCEQSQFPRSRVDKPKMHRATSRRARTAWPITTRECKLRHLCNQWHSYRGDLPGQLYSRADREGEGPGPLWSLYLDVQRSLIWNCALPLGYIYDTGPAEILIETARESCVYRHADPL